MSDTMHQHTAQKMEYGDVDKRRAVGDAIESAVLEMGAAKLEYNRDGHNLTDKHFRILTIVTNDSGNVVYMNSENISRKEASEILQAEGGWDVTA